MTTAPRVLRGNSKKQKITMKVTVNGEEKILTLTDNGIEITEQWLREAGAMPGEFEKNNNGVWECDEETYEFFAAVLAAAQKINDEKEAE